MRVINFYGGAGIGKSTIAADIFSKLKRKGHKTEMVGEYANGGIFLYFYRRVCLSGAAGGKDSYTDG
ncbi:MAG: hypothetical protein J6O13_01810 [Selenomonas sp.]|nr:hypothetical protein [Selenomonas sp.]